MGIAAYNRGSRLISAAADEAMSPALEREERRAWKDRAAAAERRVVELENELRRARRCLAAERMGREALRIRLQDEERGNAYWIGLLCRIAFPKDQT